MGAEGVTHERRSLPQIRELEDCDFPIIRSDIEGYQVLELPPALRALFDEEGASIVRINSIERARSLPDFSGKTSANHSLLPHQDFPPRDRRRFLILSKLTEGERGAATIVMWPEVAAALVPLSEAYFKQHRAVLGAERDYDKRFFISEEQYNRCFDSKDGLEEVTRELLSAHPDADASLQLFARAGLLGYLIRGPHADELLASLLETAEGKWTAERWNKGGMVIIDNAHTFHARMGGNHPPLKRNYAV